MSVLSYLTSRAASAVLSETERSNIATSVTTIGSRLDSYFQTAGDGLSGHFRFGSSTRGTILPRRDDAHSDVDYMVVFEKSGFQPQTYLDRLRRFVEAKYSTSEISQSHPTIVLNLNHIRFELVPALFSYGTHYQIPQDVSSRQLTSPNDFNATLEAANRNTSYLLKPTIRLAKIWNAANGYVYNSYLLEKWIADQWFFLCSNEREYLFKVIDLLDTNQSAQWRNDRISQAKTIVAKTREYEGLGMSISAEAEVKKLIPE